jgi:methionyl-tRNA formyltransferase
MRIDAGMDTGDILLQREMQIGPTETTPELAARLAEAGAPLMVETLQRIGMGMVKPQPQRHPEATYAPLLKKENGRIEWNRPAQEIYNRMRAFTPWPGAYTTFRGRVCHIVAQPASKEMGAAAAPGNSSAAGKAAPGTIRLTKAGLLVACGGATELHALSVKVGGGRSVDALEYASSTQLTEGERFGDA